MSAEIMIKRRVVLGLLCALAGGGALRGEAAQAAPLLRSADIRIAITADGACSVVMALVVDGGGGGIDHRIAAADGMQIDVSGLRGARQLRQAQIIGRTRSLLLETESTEYEFRYSVLRAAEHKCPLWVPTAPADGVSRAVRIRVELPSGISARNTMPAFTWNGAVGETTLGHIPAFVRVPYAPVGASSDWDVATAMDAATLVVFAGASGLWIWRRRR